ncbi:N-acetylmuramoyl-L-alanine amidase [Deinococcus sp.]|uniref:N-acetylmuramoyl-L-alanine amidase family protein n=1 Tax=Deinococcus sp. TaxID=47478 RepID=UPI00286E977F|nr:N-acetylmuramoyl-L-alanine amidase [Deinococcus sp.]
MKRSPHLPCHVLLLAGLTLIALPTLSSASAAPRVGSHDGFTRLVFVLPGPSTLSSTLSSTLGAGAGGKRVLNVTLQVPLKAERGAVTQPGVASYVQGGRKVSVQLAAGVRSATARMFPASGGQPNRLVIDVPSGGATAIPPVKPVAVKPVAAKPVPVLRPASPVVRPASTSRAPVLTVVLDAGHGGSDPGMVSRWVTEKDVTLDVALRVRKYLTQRGVHVIMVRSTDTQLGASKRADLENRSRLATAGTANAYLSIHVNGGNSAASGIETYYFGSTLGSLNRSIAVRENGEGNIGQELTRQARSTAQSLVGDLLSQAKLAFSAQLAHSIHDQLIGQTGAINRGVQADAFYVIRNPTVPAVLTEIGFGSNPAEGAKLAQAGYRDRVAGAIAKGILKFLKVN